MNRRASVIALMVGACGVIVKAAQEQQSVFTVSADRVISLEQMREASRHWTVEVPKSLTIADPDTKTRIVLSSSDIMEALR